MAQFHPADQLLQFENATSALSTMLADKKYFTGDVPSEADASVFGFLDNASARPRRPSPSTPFRTVSIFLRKCSLH